MIRLFLKFYFEIRRLERKAADISNELQLITANKSGDTRSQRRTKLQALQVKHNDLTREFQPLESSLQQLMEQVLASHNQTVRPPHSGLYLLYLFLPKKNRDPLIGDLEEEFREVYEKFGKRPAQVWYWKQVLTSLWPLMSAFLAKLAKFGFVGAVGNWIRHKISG